MPFASVCIVNLRFFVWFLNRGRQSGGSGVYRYAPLRVAGPVKQHSDAKILHMTGKLVLLCTAYYCISASLQQLPTQDAVTDRIFGLPTINLNQPLLTINITTDG